MLHRRLLGIGAILLMAGVNSCSRATEPAPFPPAPQETGDGFLTIATAELEYSLPAYGGELRATVTNTTDNVFYARLGDGFDAAVEQSTLHVAAGSHGFLEQWDSAAWQGLPRA